MLVKYYKKPKYIYAIVLELQFVYGLLKFHRFIAVLIQSQHIISLSSKIN
jgi:hypothetical protein